MSSFRPVVFNHEPFRTLEARVPELETRLAAVERLRTLEARVPELETRLVAVERLVIELADEHAILLKQLEPVRAVTRPELAAKAPDTEAP